MKYNFVYCVILVKLNVTDNDDNSGNNYNILCSLVNVPIVYISLGMSEMP